MFIDIVTNHIILYYYIIFCDGFVTTQPITPKKNSIWLNIPIYFITGEMVEGYFKMVFKFNHIVVIANNYW